MEFAPGWTNGKRENAKDEGKRISVWLMRAPRGRREEEASRGINGSVYATDFHSDVRLSLDERERNGIQGKIQGLSR